jgi:hypothetical protein
MLFALFDKQIERNLESCRPEMMPNNSPLLVDKPGLEGQGQVEEGAISRLRGVSYVSSKFTSVTLLLRRQWLWCSHHFSSTEYSIHSLTHYY